MMSAAVRSVVLGAFSRVLSGDDANILALNLWAGSAPGGWNDATDRTTTFQTADTSTPATVDGDPVQRINDKSPNGRHLIAAGVNNRGLLASSGSRRSIKLDGVDDGYATTGALATGMSVYYAINRRTDTTWVLGHGPGGTNLIFALAQASTSAPDLNCGTPTYRVNGVSIARTRQALLDACPANTPVVITIEGLSLGGLWTGPNFSTYGGFEFGGELIGYLGCPDQSAANRTIIEKYWAAKAGITF